MLVKENLPRGYWRVGRICELFPSQDRRIRSARITFGPNKFINRAISSLYPIKCLDDNIIDTTVDEGSSSSPPTEGKSDDNDHLPDHDSDNKDA